MYVLLILIGMVFLGGLLLMNYFKKLDYYKQRDYKKWDYYKQRDYKIFLLFYVRW